MENSKNLHDIAQSASEASQIARQTLIQKENFKKFSSFLERLSFSLKESSKFDAVRDSETLNRAIENLKAEIEAAKQLGTECAEGNRIYLLLNCKKIAGELDKTSKNISHALIPFTSGSFELESNNILANLCKNMSDTQYQVSAIEQEILQKIETGIEDRRIDRSYASNLLVHIAESLGISCESSELKMEFERFKKEIENIESSTEALRMEQIIRLLSNADMVTTPKEKEIKYLTKRISLGRHLLEPLPSFYCPIKLDIMEDPVETPAGHTFERAAIEKWLMSAEGNSLCPMTKMPLSRSSLRPNRVLRQSIEEWRNRNIMISIASMKPEIQSNDELEVLRCLNKLRDLCETSQMHREWIVMEDYIPIVAGLLSAKTSEFRVRSLAVLYYLAKDSDDNKERIVKENDSIVYIVRSLARKVEESLSALQLLLELSRITHIKTLIGGTQGCILLLVTLANSDDPQASKYAQEVLKNLAFVDTNIIQMARAKFFKPLLHRLCEGPVSIQITMADTLAEVELTDHNKLCLFRDGALHPLLQMLRNSDIDVKAAAVKALQNLSGVAQNGLRLIKEGAKESLFELLFCHSLSSSSSKLREQVARTVMHLAMSTTSSEASEEQISLVETEEDIFKLFSLISYSGPDMQETLLLTFLALCKSPTGSQIRNDLRQISAVKVLVQLCELDDLSVRAAAVKLLYRLTQDGDHTTFLDHVNKKCTENLVKIIETSKNEEEAAAAMGVISHLPRNLQISEHLLDSGGLEVIFDCLNYKNTHTPHVKELVENAAEALSRFTVSTNPMWQKRVAEAGMIPVLVKLLSTGPPLAKSHAAVSLKQFSESSGSLSSPVKMGGVLGCCFGSPPANVCQIHGGVCSTESSFCLLEAGAVGPLVAVLGENDDLRVCEASLDAILTLIDGVQLQSGCKVLDEGGALVQMIKILNCSCTNELQEKMLGALQRIFRLVEYKTKYGKSAQMSLVDITQRGSSGAKSLAAKILVQLNVLNEQSTFF
ncbi:hypothetical protein ABFX02_06G099400 [Erythranthe guttata]